MNNERQLIRHSKNEIKKGSKSFALASFFFRTEQRQGAWLLYSWCRHVDDQIDKAESKQEALTRLTELEKKTRACYESAFESRDKVFQGLSRVIRKFQIPQQYPLDMLRGMRMDVEGRKYASLTELEDYCYCVAGTVGLMMCHVMGVSDQKALKHAVHLGSAMQMTNISRDVKEDWSLGRIYFPLPWLSDLGMTEQSFGDPIFRKKWAQLSERLLRQADGYYQSGWEGLKYLPFRAAVAVAVAAQVYSRIGFKVRQRGEKAWNNRCYLGLSEKIWISVLTSFKLLRKLAPRVYRPWRPQPISIIWRQT